MRTTSFPVRQERVVGSSSGTTHLPSDVDLGHRRVLVVAGETGAQEEFLRALRRSCKKDVMYYSTQPHPTLPPPTHTHTYTVYRPSQVLQERRYVLQHSTTSYSAPTHTHTHLYSLPPFAGPARKTLCITALERQKPPTLRPPTHTHLYSLTPFAGPARKTLCITALERQKPPTLRPHTHTHTHTHTHARTYHTVYRKPLVSEAHTHSDNFEHNFSNSVIHENCMYLT